MKNRADRLGAHIPPLGTFGKEIATFPSHTINT